MTIAETLHKLAPRVAPRPVGPRALRATVLSASGQAAEQPPLEDARLSEDGQQAQERAQRISYVREVAQAQAKKGDPNPPPEVEAEVPAEVWEKEYAKVIKARTDGAGHVMTELLLYLAQATVPEQEGFRPEEAGAALLGIKPQDRALTILRDSIAWLQRVREVAEREQGRMQSPE